MLCYTMKRRTEWLTCPITLSSNSFTLLAPKSPQHFLNVDLSLVFAQEHRMSFYRF